MVPLATSTAEPETVPTQAPAEADIEVIDLSSDDEAAVASTELDNIMAAEDRQRKVNAEPVWVAEPRWLSCCRHQNGSRQGSKRTKVWLLVRKNTAKSAASSSSSSNYVSASSSMKTFGGI